MASCAYRALNSGAVGIDPVRDLRAVMFGAYPPAKQASVESLEAFSIVSRYFEVRDYGSMHWNFSDESRAAGELIGRSTKGFLRAASVSQTPT
jgi:hypothetical protein